MDDLSKIQFQISIFISGLIIGFLLLLGETPIERFLGIIEIIGSTWALLHTFKVGEKREVKK